MAKKKTESDILMESEEMILTEPKSDQITIDKYLKLHTSGIHSYSRAYLIEQFRGIMNSKEAWDKKINKIMEGGK